MGALNPERNASSNNGLKNQSVGIPAADFECDGAYDYLDMLEAPAEAYERDLGPVPIVITENERAQYQRDVALEYALNHSSEQRVDLLVAVIQTKTNPLETCFHYRQAIHSELVETGARLLTLAGDNSLDINPVLFKNTVLLADELRTHGELKLVSRLNAMLTEEASKANEVALHGHALLEVFDFFLERRQADLAQSYLKRAIHILRESDPASQIVVLPRVQSLLEQVDSGDVSEIQLGRSARKFYKDTLKRIVAEAPDPLAPEVLDTCISDFQTELRMGRSSTAKLVDMEMRLYPLASKLRDEVGFEDYFGEVLVVLGDVFSALNNRESAVESYLNAVDAFERVEDSDNQRLRSELHSARGKAIEILKELSDPRLAEQMQRYSSGVIE